MGVGGVIHYPRGPDLSPSLPISFLTSTHLVIFHKVSQGSNWKSLDESIFTAAAKWIVISHQRLSPATVQAALSHQIWITQMNPSTPHHQHQHTYTQSTNTQRSFNYKKDYPNITQQRQLEEYVIQISREMYSTLQIVSLLCSWVVVLRKLVCGVCNMAGNHNSI